MRTELDGDASCHDKIHKRNCIQRNFPDDHDAEKVQNNERDRYGHANASCNAEQNHCDKCHAEDTDRKIDEGIVYDCKILLVENVEDRIGKNFC